MRILDILVMDEKFITSYAEEKKIYKKEQVEKQIKDQFENGTLTFGLKLKKKGLSKFTYTFYLKDYEKRIERQSKCAIQIITSSYLYKEEESFYRTLDDFCISCKIKEQVPFKKTYQLQHKKMRLHTEGLKDILRKIARKELERRMEDDILSATITFKEKDA